MTHVAELRQMLMEVQELGGARNLRIADLAMQRALGAALMGSKLQTVHLAPVERKTYSEIIET